MIFLVAGIALWWGAHLFKRLSPRYRAELELRFGDGAKGIVALALLLAVALMVIGYKRADFTPLYQLPAWAVHLNNLLMFVAVALFGARTSKGCARSWLRHPMLTGFMVWAVAHLLVNGDLASLVLFGGLLLWAPVAMATINAQTEPWTRPEPGPAVGDVRLLVSSAIVFAVIAFIHGLLGPSPFPG